MRIGFLGLLTLLFVGLKLCNIITWSWLWVLCPLWIIPILVISLVLIVLLLAFLAGITGDKEEDEKTEELKSKIKDLFN